MFYILSHRFKLRLRQVVIPTWLLQDCQPGMKTDTQVKSVTCPSICYQR